MKKIFYVIIGMIAMTIVSCNKSTNTTPTVDVNPDTTAVTDSLVSDSLVSDSTLTDTLEVL